MQAVLISSSFVSDNDCADNAMPELPSAYTYLLSLPTFTSTGIAAESHHSAYMRFTSATPVTLVS